MMPYVKILFLPCISATLPNGTRKTADANIYEVATQPIKTASIDNSCPIEGSAIFTEDPIKGVRNEAIVAIIRVTFLLARELVRFAIAFNTPGLNEQTSEAHLIAAWGTEI
jgi:hypothetical protein